MIIETKHSTRVNPFFDRKFFIKMNQTSYLKKTTSLVFRLIFKKQWINTHSKLFHYHKKQKYDHYYPFPIDN